MNHSIMKRYFVIFLIFGISTLGCTQAQTCDGPSPMPDGHVEALDGICYYISPHYMKKSHDDAANFCSRRLGGTLAMPKTKKINNFLESALIHHKAFTVFWIGLGDQEKEGHFQWADGTDMAFHNFGAIEGPNNKLSHRSEDCTVIEGFTGAWMDYKCKGFSLFSRKDHRFLCQYKTSIPSTTHETTTTTTTKTTTTSSTKPTKETTTTHVTKPTTTPQTTTTVGNKIVTQHTSVPMSTNSTTSQTQTTVSSTSTTLKPTITTTTTSTTTQTDTTSKTQPNLHKCPSTIPRNEYLTVFGESCYFFYPHAKQSAPKARVACENLGIGGHLADLKTKSIEEFVIKQLKTQINAETEFEFWIGLSDEAQENVYQWSDGSVANYTNWGSFQGPLNTWSSENEDCVSLNTADESWHDLPCHSDWYDGHGFVCQFDFLHQPTLIDPEYEIIDIVELVHKSEW